MSSAQYLQKFQKNLIDFLDELVEQFPEEEEIIMSNLLIKTQIPVKMVIDKFIQFFIPNIDLIKTRDDRFFLSENDIFSQINPNKSGTLKRIWKSRNIDDEDREIIWSWIETLVSITMKYQNSI